MVPPAPKQKKKKKRDVGLFKNPTLLKGRRCWIFWELLVGSRRCQLFSVAELDAVCSAVSNLSFISHSPLYSDLAEVERASILERFCQSTSEWSQNIDIPEDCGEPRNADHKSSMIVVTDASLPSIVLGEGPISARVLINYELLTKKDLTTGRRIGSGHERGGINYLDDGVPPTGLVARQPDSILLWYWRLDHPSLQKFWKHT